MRIRVLFQFVQQKKQTCNNQSTLIGYKQKSWKIFEKPYFFKLVVVWQLQFTVSKHCLSLSTHYKKKERGFDTKLPNMLLMSNVT